MSFTLEPKHADWLKDLSEAKKLSTSEFLNQLISRELSRVSTRLQIEVPRQKLREFCVRNQIARLSFFGSVLTAHFSSRSDIDVLVEFKAGQGPGLFGLAAMGEELARLFGGRKVDLRTPQDLSRYFRDEVLRDAEVAYVL